MSPAFPSPVKVFLVVVLGALLSATLGSLPQEKKALRVDFLDARFCGGRFRCMCPPTKDRQRIEKLPIREYKLIEDVLSLGKLTEDWSRTWSELADDRIALAEKHLATACMMQELACGEDEGALRSAVSRAYYSMFCAARAVISLHQKGDANDHMALPGQIDKTTSIGPKDDRSLVYSALAKFRGARNNADYSVHCPSTIRADAEEATDTARQVLHICRRWVREIQQVRGIK